jgi:ABC-type sugar transport system ATPase subunit
LSKQYGGVQALFDGNGVGNSALMKILSGYQQPFDKGAEMLVA